MSKVVANVSMSLEGFIGNEVGRADGLFGWMGSGDAEVPPPARGNSGCLRPENPGRG